MTSVTAKGLFDVPSKLYLGLRWEINYWDQIDGKNVRKDVPEVKAPQMDTTKYPLGFVTYFDSDNQAWRKRKATVDGWSDIDRAKAVVPSADGIFLDNTPLDGFQIFDFDSRWTTSNKWFCVKDPRGFHLQISAAALIDLLNHADIKKGGYIQGKCLWGRRDGTNIVVPVDSDLYRETVKLNAAPKTYGVGDMVIIGKGEYVYLGEFYELDIAVGEEDSLLPYTQQRDNSQRLDISFEYNASTLEKQQRVKRFRRDGYSSLHRYWKSVTPQQIMDELTYNVGFRIDKPAKKVYAFAQVGTGGSFYLQKFKSKPKIKGVIGPYVAKDGDENPFKLVTNKETAHKFNLGKDIYNQYGHRLRWSASLHFNSAAERDAFDLDAVRKCFPKQIKCISCEVLPEEPQVGYGVYESYKITYEAVF